MLLARNADAAVLVGGIVAYPAGFSLNVTAIARMDGQRMFDPFGPHGPGNPWPHDEPALQALLFGMAFSDGTKATTIEMGPPMGGGGPGDRGSRRTLMSRGGGGGGRKWTQGFWCEPLPPPGPMAFVIEWRRFDIPETHIEIDAQLILNAAGKAEPIWPDDVGLPADEPDVRAPQPGLAQSVMVSFEATDEEDSEPS